jgi:MFS family permease
MAIITSLFAKEKELYIGILEAGVGIGLLVGPLLGAFLYSIGGFILPFWTVAGICLALYPMLLQTVKFIQAKEAQIADNFLNINAIIEEATSAEEQDTAPTAPPKKIAVKFG